MIRLDMRYKGERDYLHGTDFHEEITTKLSEIICAGFTKKICFKSFSRKQCFLVLNERPSQNLRQIGNGLWLNDNGDETKFWIVDGEMAVASRYPFDEDKLVSPSSVAECIIKLEKNNEFSTIENIVALTKKLNYTLTPNASGKWVFGQIELLKPLPENFDQIQIERISERKGMFSCNQITIDKELIGEIRFIVGTP